MSGQFQLLNITQLSKTTAVVDRLMKQGLSRVSTSVSHSRRHSGQTSLSLVPGFFPSAPPLPPKQTRLPTAKRVQYSHCCSSTFIESCLLANEISHTWSLRLKTRAKVTITALHIHMSSISHTKSKSFGPEAGVEGGGSPKLDTTERTPPVMSGTNYASIYV